LPCSSRSVRPGELGLSFALRCVVPGLGSCWTVTWARTEGGLHGGHGVDGGVWCGSRMSHWRDEAWWTLSKGGQCGCKPPATCLGCWTGINSQRVQAAKMSRLSRACRGTRATPSTPHSQINPSPNREQRPQPPHDITNRADHTLADSANRSRRRGGVGRAGWRGRVVM
jgi:hypothetical protein